MSKGIEATTDVQLREDLRYLAELPECKEFMEFNGTMVIGESQGNDLSLIVFAWHAGGRQQGKWKVNKAVIGHTTFLVMPHTQGGGKYDNDSIGNRREQGKWKIETQIIHESDKIIWQTGERLLICRPPYWEYKGEYLGVECDLVLDGLGKITHSYYGTWPDLSTKLRAGYEQHCRVEGTITVGGKEYVLENGYGIHDLIDFGETCGVT